MACSTSRTSGRVGHIEDVIERGDVLDVLVQEVDKARGRIGLKLIAKHENGSLVQPEELIDGAMKVTTSPEIVAGYVRPAHVYVTDCALDVLRPISTNGSPERSASGSSPRPMSGSASFGGVCVQLTAAANAM